MNLRYVTNIWQLLDHVTRHRRRVLFLAMHQSPLVEFNTRAFLLVWMHDIEKYLFLPWLWKYYGDRRDRNKARKVYDRMNAVGSSIRKAAAWVMCVSKGRLHYLDQVERMVDVVDRHCDAATLEEFGLAVQRPLSDFLKADWIADATVLAKGRWMVMTGMAKPAVEQSPERVRIDGS